MRSRFNQGVLLGNTLSTGHSPDGYFSLSMTSRAPALAAGWRTCMRLLPVLLDLLTSPVRDLLCWTR